MGSPSMYPRVLIIYYLFLTPSKNVYCILLVTATVNYYDDLCRLFPRNSS